MRIYMNAASAEPSASAHGHVLVAGEQDRRRLAWNALLRRREHRAIAAELRR